MNIIHCKNRDFDLPPVHRWAGLLVDLWAGLLVDRWAGLLVDLWAGLLVVCSLSLHSPAVEIHLLFEKTRATLAAKRSCRQIPQVERSPQREPAMSKSVAVRA